MVLGMILGITIVDAQKRDGSPPERVST